MSSAFITGPVPSQFEREVTASAEEFVRDLRKAWRGELIVESSARLVLASDELQLSIQLSRLEPLRIGLLSLPRLLVSYRFSECDEASRRRLIEGLDRAMQRGGG